MPSVCGKKTTKKHPDEWQTKVEPEYFPSEWHLTYTCMSYPAWGAINNETMNPDTSMVTPTTRCSLKLCHWSLPFFSVSFVCALTLPTNTFSFFLPSPYICNPPLSLHPSHQPLPSPTPYIPPTRRIIFSNPSLSLLLLCYSLQHWPRSGSTLLCVVLSWVHSLQHLI